MQFTNLNHVFLCHIRETNLASLKKIKINRSCIKRRGNRNEFSTGNIQNIHQLVPLKCMGCHLSYLHDL